MKDEKKKADFAVVKIKKSTHKKLKIEAAKEGKTIQDLVEGAIVEKLTKSE